MNSLRLALFITIIFSLPSVVLGSPVVRSGDIVSIAEDQAVEGDFYGLSNNIVVSGEVTDDLLGGGTDITINGKIGSDLAAVAGRVDVNGLVGDDARIVAGQVTIAGEIKGDLVVVAGSLKVLSTAKIDGDILFFGSEADIAGEVGKSILGTGEKIRIDAVVGGDVDVKTTNLALGEKAEITGMVKYTSGIEMVRAQNSRVSGKILWNNSVPTNNNDKKESLISLLVLLFAALVWYLFFRRLLERIVAQTGTHILRSMLIGFGLFFLIPIAVLILIMSTLGSLLGITLVFIYFSLILISMTISGIVTGVYLAKLVIKSSAITIPVVLIGTASFFALSYIPILGPIIMFGLLFVTLGALATHLYRIIRFS